MNIGIIGNTLKTLETSSSIGMFARDTGGCLISKLALSRSSDETREISTAELAESAIFYFSAPFLAKNTAKVMSKAFKVNKNLIDEPVRNLKYIDAELLKKVKLGKFMRAASVFSLVLPAVFAIAPLRNYLTLGKTGKEKFVNVINLDKTKQTEQKKTAAEKTKKLAKVLSIAAAGGLAASAGIAALSKNNGFYKKAEPFIDKFIKHFDFAAGGDLTLEHYGALIYPVSIASYFYASRDKYEKQENARRFAVTVPLMFFGEKLIQNPIHKAADKIFKTNIFNNGNIKSYNEIMKLPEKLRGQAVKAKNAAYGLTFFINTMAIAAGAALLNRYETKRRYMQENQKNDTGSAEKISFKQQIEGNELWKDMKI